MTTQPDAEAVRKLVEAARAAEFALRAPDALLVEESRAALEEALKPFAAKTAEGKASGDS
jgi:hypothetical protein